MPGQPRYPLGITGHLVLEGGWLLACGADGAAWADRAPPWGGFAAAGRAQRGAGPGGLPPVDDAADEGGLPGML